MIEFATQDDFAVDPHAYKGRWGYFEAARDYILGIPGMENWRPEDVLEIGPYKVPLVRGCDTMDVEPWLDALTHRHDAGKVPWPVEDGRYRLMVALQVWEHLRGRQREAWREVERVADWAVISLPYRWPKPPDHARIEERTICEWTQRRTTKAKLVKSSVSQLRRIVCLYDLRSKPQAKP